MSGKFLFLHLILIPFTENAFAQGRYPADVVLRDSSIFWYKKAAILPIAAWQRISYNTILFECPYFPSCSNYFALSVQKTGLLRSISATSSRLLRCHPLAHQSHKNIARRANKPPLDYYDGRYVDSLLINPKRKAKPAEMALSAMVPGLGMVKQRRVADGVFTFIMVAGSAYAFQSSVERNQVIPSVVWGLATVTFYSGNLYSTRNY